MEFSNWNQTTGRVSTLLLDPQNPRLPGGRDGLTQQQILAELIEHDDVMSLARQISERGYFPTEVLIAVEEDDKIVVVEGNRRLAALKCLSDPLLAPEKYRKRFQALAQRVPSETLRKCLITIAPSRRDAVPVLLGRHTQDGIMSWSPAMQAKYVTSLAQDGMTPEELRSTYGLQPKDLSAAVLRNTLYDMARAIDLPADVKAIVDNPRDFPLTTLERVVEMVEGQKFLGIKLDAQHGIRGTVPSDEFKKGFRRLVIDVAKGELTSRNGNTGEGLRDHLKKYAAEDRPDTEQTGEFTPSDITGQSEGQEEEPTPAPKPAPRAPKASKSIIPRELRCTVSEHRLQEVFKEAKKLSLTEHPNSSALMVRTLLELALTGHLARAGEDKKFRQAIEAKQGSSLPRNWHPELRSLLAHFLKLDEASATPSLDGQQRRALKKMNEEKDCPVTIDSLNAFVHSPWETPTDKELRAISIKLTPLLQVLLNPK